MDEQKELELRARIVEVATKVIEAPEAIYVRARVDGQWRSVSLAELPPSERAEWIGRWVMEGS